jgi:hypothetical protein
MSRSIDLSIDIYLLGYPTHSLTSLTPKFFPVPKYFRLSSFQPCTLGDSALQMLKRCCLRLLFIATVAVVAIASPFNDAWEASVENAVRDDDVVGLEKLLKTGTPEEVVVKLHEQFTNGGMTLLQWAGKKGSANAARVLLQAGADPRLPHFPTGTTPLMFAAREGNVAAVSEFLQAAAAEPGLVAQLLGAVDEHGNSALHLAAFDCHAKVADLLSSSGETFLSHANAQGATALHIASFYCPTSGSTGPKFARTLLGESELGPTPGVNALTTTNGRTALMLAAQRGISSLVEVILVGGADPALVSPVDGLTAASMARSAGHTAIAKRLEGIALDSSHAMDL